MLEQFGLLALGSLGTLFLLALWARLDVFSRIRFDGELRIGPRKIDWADFHERQARVAKHETELADLQKRYGTTPEPAPEYVHRAEDYFDMSKRLAREDGDGKS